MNQRSMFHDDLVPPDDRPRWQDAFTRCGDAVSVCVDTFLWAFEEFRDAAYKEQRDTHAVPLMLMLDFADAADGVAILSRRGSARNCSQLLRTCLEIQLAVKYMMEHKDTYERRVLSYEYYHLQDQWRWAQRCDEKSQIGRQLRTELAGEKLLDIFDAKGRDVTAEAQEFETKMSSARYAAVRAELARMKTEKIRDQGWYSLWGGPKSVRGVAIHLRMGVLYEALYRSWSNVTHGEGAAKRATGGDGKILQITPLRSPQRLSEMCRNACHQCNSMTLLIVHGLLPHLKDEAKERYLRDMKPGLAYIDNIQGL